MAAATTTSKVETKPRKRRRGAVTVEFAITVGLLFFLILTSIEFFRVNVIRHTVDNAAYEGARRGIVPGASRAQIETAVNTIMSSVSARNITITVNPAVINDDTEEVSVSVSAPLGENGFIAPIFFDGLSFTGTSSMLREQL